MVKADIKQLISDLTVIAALKTVDLDKLQLENESDEHPINLPAVYLSYRTEWQPPTGNSQKGESQVTVRVATEHYRDTHGHSVKFDEAMDEAFDLPELVVAKLEECGLTLSSDEYDPLFTNIKVHRYTFIASVIRSRTKLTVRIGADLNTTGNILPDE